MMLLNRKRLIGLLSLLFLSNSPAYSNLIANGSFESPGIGPATFSNIGFESEPTNFAWKVTTNSVDIQSNGVLGTLGTAYDGVQSLDLVGFGSTGGISQTFETVAGVRYVLSFVYANNPISTSTASASVAITDGLTSVFSQSISHNTSSSADFDWTLFEAVFQGSGSPFKLTFETTVGGNNGGIFLDAVTISQVPLPAAAWLLVSGLVAATSACRAGFSRGVAEQR